MRKLLMLFLLFSLCVKISGERVKDVCVSFNKDDFSIIIANNIAHISTDKFLYSYGNDLSSPALPKVLVNLLISPNEELLDFSYTKTERKIIENVFMATCPEIIPTNIPIKLNSDTIVSYMQDLYPQTFVNYMGSHVISGYKCLSFEICPFRYDNVCRILYMEQDFTFKISLQTNASKKEVEIRQGDEAIISSLVVNPEDISLYDNFRVSNRQGQRTTHEYEYAIITNNNLKSMFQKLANWKTQKGVRTTVLTVEDIYAAFPDTCSQQMKIKITLKNLYDNNPNFKYVLLAGDVDVVPAQMCFVKHIAYQTYTTYCPTDLFYADFHTMNWDPNGNGIVGELEDDFNISQDVAITRVPVSTINDAEAFVNRIISYESTPNIHTWSNNILMSGCMLYNTFNINGVTMSDAHIQGEKLYNDICPIMGVDSVRKVKFYDTGTDFPGGSYGEDYDFNAQNIQTELSKGYTFVNVDTHGSAIDWSTEGSGYTVSCADTLNNSNHTIIITSACLTNAFDTTPKCLSEAFIRNPNSGIVAYFGCSRLGWHNGDKEVLSPSNVVNRILYRKLFSDTNKNFGEIVRQVKINLIPGSYTYDNPNRWLLFGLNPIGDPEMPIFTRTPQKFANVSISFSNGFLTIDTGVSDCKICVASSNDLGDSYYDVRTGMNASYTNLTNEYSICITKPGFVPYIAKCGNTVYMQNESVNRDYEVFSNQTIAGSNVTISIPNGPVEINKGNTIIKGTNGVTVNDSFEVKKGASLEMRTN